MNQRGILAETVLLVVLSAFMTGILSDISQNNQTHNSLATQEYYSVSTQWQNTRFLLEQDTVNQIWETIVFPDCTYNPITPNFDPIFSQLQTDTTVLCTTSPLSLFQSDTEFSFDLTCSQDFAPGTHVSFSHTVTFKKEITSQTNNSNGCDVSILDLQSKEYDVKTGG